MAASMDLIFSRRFCSFPCSFGSVMRANCVVIVLMMWMGTVGSVDRPRGVPLEKMSLYNPNHQFTCFDGSQTFEFERVNDDYCDCSDGSDEPGTSACPNGFFSCRNKGHLSKSFPSSRVNDGICDCCDGSDEYGKHELCEDTCLELGRAAREELEKRRVRLVEGNTVYLEYVSQGERARKENKERLEGLVKEKESLENDRSDLEEKKKVAEEPEKEAKDAHQKAWEEVKAKRDAEVDQAKAEAAFSDLDADQDNSVSISELTSRTECDTDGDGQVTEEEAKAYLLGYDNVDLGVFKENIWSSFKSTYKSPTTEQPTETTPPPETIDEEFPPEEKDDEDEDEYGDEKLTDQPGTEENEDKMPEYNDDTKKLIETADFARAAFNEIDRKYGDLEKEIRDLEEVASIDFGPQEAFYPLKGQCFEYTDREYTYKLCPFDKASQRSKTGGGETSLGRWGSWVGSNEDHFDRMKYEGGQNCWNGPDRSLTVSLICGRSNEITSVSEPNRCEYHADFYTPALCSQIPPPVEKDPQRDEL